MVRQIVASRTLTIPEGVELKVKSRQVYVKGPRGTSRQADGSREPRQ